MSAVENAVNTDVHVIATLPDDGNFTNTGTGDGARIDEPLDEDEDMQYAKVTRRRRAAIGVILLGIVIFVIVDSVTNEYIKSGFQELLNWFDTNKVGGCFAFTGFFFVATLAFVPGAILTLGSGYVFGACFGLGVGVLVGSLSVFVGASLGSIASFLIGRYLCRDWAKRVSNKYSTFRAIDAAMKERGFRICFLLRLSPIIPFNVLNYIAGATSITFRSYTLALTGILPGTVLYVFLGAGASSVANSGSAFSGPIVVVSIVVGVVLGVVAIIAIAYYAKKELDNVIKENEGTIIHNNQTTDETEGVVSEKNEQLDQQIVDPAEEILGENTVVTAV